LEEAREVALQYRKLLREGVDPAVYRQQQKQKALDVRAKAVTFREVTDSYIALRVDDFRNDKHRKQWRSTLEQHVFPRIGGKLVADITTPDILSFLVPMWSTKRETAGRILQRVRRVLEHAKGIGLYSGDNPAGRHVAEALPGGKRDRKHHAALPYSELPDFLVGLRKRKGVSVQALEFIIATATRVGEVCDAVWDEFNLAERTWVIPAARYKTHKDHRIPLSSRAMELLQQARDEGRDRPFGVSVAAVDEIRRKVRTGITTHGFRSAFKGWCLERTNYGHEMSEVALGHNVGNKVAEAYRRVDMLAKRARMMQQWSEFCSQPVIAGSTTNGCPSRSDSD
jgi:integrase